MIYFKHFTQNGHVVQTAYNHQKIIQNEQTCFYSLSCSLPRSLARLRLNRNPLASYGKRTPSPTVTPAFRTGNHGGVTDTTVESGLYGFYGTKGDSYRKAGKNTRNCAFLERRVFVQLRKQSRHRDQLFERQDSGESPSPRGLRLQKKQRTSFVISTSASWTTKD